MPPIPKPEPHAKVKARRKRVTAAARKKCREAVIKKADSQCARCGGYASDDVPEWHPQRAHVNEIIPRSLGGSPIDMKNLELLCAKCHLPGGIHAPTRERWAAITGRKR